MLFLMPSTRSVVLMRLPELLVHSLMVLVSLLTLSHGMRLVLVVMLLVLTGKEVNNSVTQLVLLVVLVLNPSSPMLVLSSWQKRLLICTAGVKTLSSRRNSNSMVKTDSLNVKVLTSTSFNLINTTLVRQTLVSTFTRLLFVLKNTNRLVLATFRELITPLFSWCCRTRLLPVLPLLKYVCMQ